MAHFMQVCEHGRVVAQCRCPGPKTATVVPCLDDAWHRLEHERVFDYQPKHSRPE